MWWWRKKQEVRAIHPEIHESFGRVRQDTTALFQWVDYLYRMNVTHHSTLNSLKAQTAALHQLVDELRTHASSHKALLADIHSKVSAPVALEQVHSRLRSVEEKLANLHTWKPQPAQSMQSSLQSSLKSSVNDSPVQLISQVSTPLKERILRRISRNSKDYIKSVLRSMIFKYGKISALQLRDIVVDEQGLCSRSSFYRILDEVEGEEDVLCEQSGKEKEYVANPKIIKTQT
ncbi:MAG: hypothetical protein HY363_05555 [Candidatus Aenigmarchaeota archaeon]|nr:hypothetical protein [Candidatus Aenigmarchaeota archaeon]